LPDGVRDERLSTSEEKEKLGQVAFKARIGYRYGMNAVKINKKMEEKCALIAETIGGLPRSFQDEELTNCSNYYYGQPPTFSFIGVMGGRKTINSIIKIYKLNPYATLSDYLLIQGATPNILMEKKLQNDIDNGENILISARHQLQLARTIFNYFITKGILEQKFVIKLLTMSMKQSHQSSLNEHEDLICRIVGKILEQGSSGQNSSLIPPQLVVILLNLIKAYYNEYDRGYDRDHKFNNLSEYDYLKFKNFATVLQKYVDSSYNSEEKKDGKKEKEKEKIVDAIVYLQSLANKFTRVEILLREAKKLGEINGWESRASYLTNYLDEDDDSDTNNDVGGQEKKKRVKKSKQLKLTRFTIMEELYDIYRSPGIVNGKLVKAKI
jgi:hypothetical protein